ncbi:hypothetical protein LOTGIDRAFT_234725 [Lottia gigantea]|uniref:EGF-like calcium-binding domain-containing protein n=1 Tax=Lottia gigantea TaxID=225164 RepID=V3ZUY1_LOTGI|nr:hypothetical protein LOTGIDRAFT_234725 [Lottia gigantea]ESO88177.1 hypothetical protein LOTGIDRAFT_234725 [Lottia gigantea]
MLSIRVLGLFAVIAIALVLVESEFSEVCYGELPANAMCSVENNKTRRCQCKEGYEMDIICTSNGSIFSCQDIDECATNNGSCEFKCQNEPGSYNCSCPEGSELQENGLNCEPIKPGPCMFENQTVTGVSQNFNRTYIGNENETECEKKCNTTVGCTDWLILDGHCQNFGLPIIQVELIPDGSPEKCKDLCAQNKKCVTAQYFVTCTLFDTKQTEFDDGCDPETVFHKIDMNCLN